MIVDQKQTPSIPSATPRRAGPSDGIADRDAKRAAQAAAVRNEAGGGAVPVSWPRVFPGL